jgi:hypothetical protein
MIMFYDVLLCDDAVCLYEPLEQRRRRIRSLIRCIPGLAELGTREIVHFSASDAKDRIRVAFAKAISKGWEGFVLKGCDDPYFSLTGPASCIKLKKDYIIGLGDIADLAIIGGRRDKKVRQALDLGQLSWTAFHLACLENRDEVHRFCARPTFRIVGEVTATNQTISIDRTHYLNKRGQFGRLPYAPVTAEMEVINDQNIDAPTDLFLNPFIVEVTGSGFEKPQNVTYQSLRFPRITKIHEDRTIRDVMSFDSLQSLALDAQTLAMDDCSEEDREWIAKLQRADSKSKFVAEDSACTVDDASSGCDMLEISELRDHQISVSPSVVRTDTQEMAEQENWDKILPEGCALSTSATVATPTSLKRQHRGEEVNPRASGSSKRIKSTGNGKSLSTENLLSRDMAQRTPLREIQNLEQSMSAKSSLQRSDRASSPPGKDHSLAPSLPSLKAENRDGRAQASACEQSRSPKTAQKDPADGLSGLETPMPHPVRKTVHPRPPQNPVRVSDVLQRCSSTIYISAELANTTGKSTPSSSEYQQPRSTLSRLATLPASFTFCRELFLNAIFPQASRAGASPPPTQPHIGFVNTADPIETGQQIATFHREILERLGQCRNRRATADRAVGECDGELETDYSLIFFDYGKLMHPHHRHSCTAAKAAFSGCLTWNLSHTEVRITWTWNDVAESFLLNHGRSCVEPLAQKCPTTPDSK